MKLDLAAGVDVQISVGWGDGEGGKKSLVRVGVVGAHRPPCGF